MTYRSLFMLDLRSFPSFHGWNKNSRCVSIQSPVESIGMKEVEEREGKRERRDSNGQEGLRYPGIRRNKR